MGLAGCGKGVGPCDNAHPIPVEVRCNETLYSSDVGFVVRTGSFKEGSIQHDLDTKEGCSILPNGQYIQKESKCFFWIVDNQILPENQSPPSSHSFNGFGFSY